MSEFFEGKWEDDRLFHLLIVLILGTRTFLFRLERAAIQGYDEGLYAAGATHVFDGYWLVHHHTLARGTGQYVPHLQKPPLVPWLQAMSMAILGETAFAARLPSALAGVAVPVVLVYLGREFVDFRVGLFAAVVFITTPQVFTGTNAFRQATTDGVLVLLGTLFIGATWLAAYRDRRYFYAVGVLAPLLVLTKSVQAGIFVIAVVPVFALNVRRFVSREFAVAVAATFAVVGSWFVPMYLRFGDEFLERFVYRQLFERVTGGLVSYEGALFGFMKYPYIQNLFSLWDPWVYFFFVGIVVLPLIHGRGEDDWLLLSLWASISIFAFFVFAGNHPGYILPMYAPGAVVVGALARDAMERDYRAQVGLVAGLVTVVLVSPRSPSPWSLPWNGLWGNRPGDVALVPLLVGVVAVVLFHSQIIRVLRSIVGSEWVERGTPAVVIAVILIFGFTISSPAVIHHGYSEEKRTLALEANDRIPESAVIYFSESSRVSLQFLTVEFYGHNNFRGVSIETLNTHQDIEYAILLPSTDEVDRPYRTMSEIRPNSPDRSVKIVRFE